MSDLNIRNIDNELHHRAKLKAAAERTPLRKVVISLLEKYVSTPAGSEELNAAHCSVNGPLIKNGPAPKERNKK